MGDIVRSQSGTDEVVNKVSVVLHLSNGMTELYEDEDSVKLLDPQPQPPTEKEVEAVVKRGARARAKSSN